jgi:hypothetical protein
MIKLNKIHNEIITFQKKLINLQDYIVYNFFITKIQQANHDRL